MKNKAFTLVELLAVIIILGLLALIITPKIQKTLKSSEKNIYESSAYALSREAENFYLSSKTEMTKFNGCTYDFTNNSNTCNGFEFKGKKPEAGTLKIDEFGNTQFILKFENNCYTKRMYSQKISVIKNCDGNIDNLIPEIVSSGDGLYESTTEPGRLIYRGGNPNNYIWLDENNDNDKATDELYRIISYETDGTIKVVRNTSIGEIAWDSRTNQTSGPRKNQENTYCDYEETNENLNSSPGQTYFGCNVWGNQQNTLYNNTSFSNKDFTYKYYQSNESTTMINGDFSGTITKNSSLNEYLNSTDNNTYWPKITTLNKYITKHSFPVGGIYYAEYSTSKQLVKEKEEEKLYTWSGKIALMNITEYVEASINPACTNVYSNFFYNTDYYKDTNNDGEKEQTITSYDNWPCSNRTYNWVANSSTEWFLTPYSKYQYTAWGINSQGYFVHFNYVSAPHNIRPTFYLNSDISLAGTGTEGDPYYIID